jgi:hypothetical protein
MKASISAPTSIVIVGLLLIWGAWSSAIAQVYRGSATSVEEFSRAQDKASKRLKGTETAEFAYCVCKKDRGKIVYVYAYSADARKNLGVSCKNMAKDDKCGGCYARPAVDLLRSAEYKAAMSGANRRKRFFSIFGRDGGDQSTGRTILPKPRD